MKANLMFLNGFWCVVIPPMKDMFSETEVETNPEKFAMPIYKVNNIIGKQNWKPNTEVEGTIIRENKKNYFVIKDVEYIKPLTEENSRVLTLLKGLIGDYKQIAITIDQYNYIHQVAKSENLISSYFSNGYCIDHKYVIFGKKTRDGKIIYPQIKIK